MFYKLPESEAEINDQITETNSKNSEKNDSKHRLGGTIGSALFALMQGVQILRVHEVNEIIQSIKIFKKLLNN